MSKPDNQHCVKCTSFGGETYDEVRNFYNKYGRSGCSGIPHRSGEFPYDSHPHCFTSEPQLTEDELHIKKIHDVEEIIKNSLSPRCAAETLVNRWDTL